MNKPAGLIGIEIQVNGTFKFVGKVGTVPKFTVPDSLVGHRIFYRELKHADVFSRATDSYSVDREAWDMAHSLEATGMVIFVKDRNETVVATADVINKSSVVDLGERPQYRIKKGLVYIHYNTAPVKMGFTTRVVRIDPQGKADPPKPLVADMQGRLF